MSLFMLETDAVTSAASSLDSLASQISSLASTVSGYDTSCEDFDFGSAKSVIAGNIQACSTKVSNTSAVLNNVVSSHTTLQGSLKFGAAAATDTTTNATNTTGNTDTTGTTGTYNSGGYSGGYYGGTPSGGGGGGGGYVAPDTTPITEPPTTVPTTGAPTTDPPVTIDPVEVDAKVSGVDQGEVDKEKLSDEGKRLFDHSDLKYNAAGYATIGGMYVISCGSEFGKVGDEVFFALKDGSTVKCIIGQVNENAGGKVSFFVNNQWNKDGANNVPDFSSNITKIYNYGANNTYTLDKTTASALDWAVDIAGDNAHGYSQTGRWDGTNYDCSSFVISAFEKAGIKVRDAGASTTANMKEAFEKAGFKWIPGTPDLSTLKPGDVLLDVNSHTELYYGNGLMVGAHSDRDGATGDFSGGEISVSKYSNKNWDGVLRYVGTGGTDTTVPPTTVQTQPPTTVQTQPPTTSAQTQPPTTSAQTQPPTTSAQTQPPTTSAQTQPPTTSAQTQPPTTSAQTQPPTTASQTTIPTEYTIVIPREGVKV